VPTSGLNDDALAQRIRDDQIDVLIDVAGHTLNNRLLVFARKPAPVSLHWLDYGYTTGLDAIDYYLTDEMTVPQGSEKFFAEKLWRLPVSIVYRPAEGMGEVSELPALAKGHITFGTLTRAVRVNHRTIRVWAEILKLVPTSVLTLNSKDFQDESSRQGLIDRFSAHGIGADRLDVGFSSPPWDTLRNMDICLDCFPHNSGTTTIEGLYMGVPVVTMYSRPSVGTLGGSMLNALGLQHLIAQSEEEYVQKAVNLATDLQGLVTLRGELRGKMQTSLLMDERGFAQKVEDAYLQMWHNYVQQVQQNQDDE
jgi:predicted O-linked N-acetylglucosamine transferase (SPINDLY family)